MRLPSDLDENLRFMVLEVRKQLEETLGYLAEPAAGLLGRIVSRDDYIDSMKGLIEEKSFSHLVGQGVERGTANLMRCLNTLASNLERIADFAVNVVGQVQYLGDPAFLARYDYQVFFDEALAGLEMVVPALHSQDMNLALRICQCEFRLDSLFQATMQQIMQELSAGKHTGDLVTALFIHRYLERMGDSLLNIGEALIFVLVGERLKIHQFEALQDTLAASGLEAPLSQVEFNTFIEMVDTIGGIDVLVTQRLVLDPLGSGKDKIVITPGYRHLNGEKALAYARTRHTEGGDVDRAKRQQDVIFAIMDKIFTPEYFPIFVKQAPELYNRVSSGVHTSISFEDGIRLAYLLSEVNRNNIKMRVIDETMTIPARIIYGGQEAAVLKPMSDRIRIVRDEVFSATGPASPLAGGEDQLKLVRDEGARVRVVNGTFAGDFGQRAAVYLQSLGVNVTEVGSANATDKTIVKLYSSKLYTMRFFLYLFGLNGASGTTQIRFEPNSSSTVDVEIILGTDALNSNVVP